MAETPTILVTSADIQKIEHEQSLIKSEIAVKEARLRRLFDLDNALNERMAMITTLLETVGPSAGGHKTRH